ncbi:potassium channel protein, partial [Candidatus Woesearchaeota archaeon]|nr:potassium channel protein [Candidatus Woesearchaeota archaeon]
RVGKSVGARLKQRRKDVVFIEKDKGVIDRLRSEGLLVMDVGPIDEKTLLEAGAENADGVVASLGDDSKNLLLTLTAKEINSHITVAVRINEAKLIPKFKKAGASLLIIPEAVGGCRLADAMLGNITDDVIVGK